MGGGTSWSLSSSGLYFSRLDLTKIFSTQPQLLWIHVCNHSVMISKKKKNVHYRYSLPVVLIIFLTPLPWWALSLRRRRFAMDVSFRFEHLTVFHYLHIVPVWVYILMTIYCNKKFLWQQLRDVLIYGHKAKSPGCSLILYAPSWGSLLVPTTLTTISLRIS